MKCEMKREMKCEMKCGGGHGRARTTATACNCDVRREGAARTRGGEVDSSGVVSYLQVVTPDRESELAARVGGDLDGISTAQVNNTTRAAGPHARCLPPTQHWRWCWCWLPVRGSCGAFWEGSAWRGVLGGGSAVAERRRGVQCHAQCDELPGIGRPAVVKSGP